MRFDARRLFFVAIVFKLGFSIAAWYFQDVWVLGFILPIVVMLLYVVIGTWRRTATVSDEKFADSCYYMGFIFTIASIILTLIDLPEIGSKLSMIAARFSVAMITTVIGVTVRVMLIGFKEDINDAMVAAEDGVIDATHKLREQLIISLEKLRSFDSEVDAATKETITRTSIGIEGIAKSNGEKVEKFFETLETESRNSFEQSLAEVKAASSRLGEFLDRYSTSMESNLSGIDNSVAKFSDTLMTKINNTSFPEDVFVAKLEAPLALLGSETQNVADKLAIVANEVKSSTQSFHNALNSFRLKADSVDAVLSRVEELASSQEQIYSGAVKQSDTISVVSHVLQALAKDMGCISSALNKQNEMTDASVQTAKEKYAETSTTVSQLLAAVNGIKDAALISNTQLVTLVESHRDQVEKIMAEIMVRKMGHGELTQKTDIASSQVHAS